LHKLYYFTKIRTFMDSQNILEKINTSALKLLAAQSLEELCPIIVEEAKQLVDAEYGAIFLQEKDKLKKTSVTSNKLLKKIDVRKKKYIEKVFQNGNISILHSNEIQSLHPELKTFDIKSIIIIPLSYRTEPIGILMLHSLKNKYFTNKKLHILKLFGSMASLAIARTRLYDETKRALEMRDRFISLASHELRTPLTSISGYIQLLHSRMHNKKTVEARWVDDLYRENIRLTNLVKDLLDINRIKQGQLAFTFSEISLKDVIEKAIKRCQLVNGDRVIIFDNKISDNKHIVVGDFERLHDMVSGLLSNAIKFSNSRSKILVSLSRTSRTVQVTIKDFGHGIAKQDLTRVFEEFYKSKNAANKGGIGVGLILAKHIVDHHRGKINISSQEKKGTVVEVILPSAQI